MLTAYLSGMANIRRFTTCPKTGNTVQLSNVYFAGTISAKPKDFIGTCPDCGERHPAERCIERKSNPSNHKCDNRCLVAKGHKCECSCGGKNHGVAS